MKRVLIVTHPFPPMGQSSGLQRPLSFTRHFPKFGYDTAVLTIHPRAYPDVNYAQVKDIPEQVPVVRAFGLDAARHMAIFGRYPQFIALPDRWISWYLGAWFSGMKLIREFKPDAIWSTYPVQTAHVIGRMLARRSGLPWIAECRDPMVLDHYPADPAQRRANAKIEKQIVDEAERVVMVTPGAARLYQERYPAVPAQRFSVVPNGYEELNFAKAEAELGEPHASSAGSDCLTLVHAGALYPGQRSPKALFKALRRLADQGELKPGQLKLILRATYHDHVYAPMIAELGVGDFVELAPSIAYVDALKEMLAADGLVIFQSSVFNRQIPAKAYEYLRARKPVLGLTDPSGDTAALLRDYAAAEIADIDDVEATEQALRAHLASIRDRSWQPQDDAVIASFSREQLAGQAAAVLDDVLGVQR